MGVGEGFAADGDEVGLAVLEDGFGLRAIEDDADGHGGDAGLGADGLGVGDLVAALQFAALLGEVHHRVFGADAAGGAVDQIDAAGVEEAGQGDAVFDGPAVGAVVEIGAPIDAGEAEEEGFAGGPVGAEGLGDFQHDAHAAGAVAAVAVVALVGDGGQEAVEQVAVGSVDIEHVKAGAVDAAGAGGVGVDEAVDFVDGHGAGLMPAGDGGVAHAADGLPGGFALCRFGFAQGPRPSHGRWREDFGPA